MSSMVGFSKVEGAKGPRVRLPLSHTAPLSCVKCMEFQGLLRGIRGVYTLNPKP